MKTPRLALLTLLLGLTHAHATEVQLILDVSGSMYNKLPDGQTRIQVAREVLTGFIASLPNDPELNVGLRLYGARTLAVGDGSCEDSELVLPLQTLNRSALQDAVRKVIPKGATPIAFSLLKAADDFSGNNDKKVVVLVTDGQESCGGDLKAAMDLYRTRNIELQVIGIDLDQRAQNSFQGIGRFQNTTTANQFAQALGVAVQEVARATLQTTQVTVQLMEGERPAAAGRKVTLLQPISGEQIPMSSLPGGVFQQTVPGGIYTVLVSGASDQRTYRGIAVNPGLDNTYTFNIETVKYPVQLETYPRSPVMGSLASVSFKGISDGAENGYITLVPTDSPDFAEDLYAWVSERAGTQTFRIPETPVPLEFRYLKPFPDGLVRVLGKSAPFIPVHVPATLKVPGQVTAGGVLQVSWTGPANDSDYLTVVPEGAPDGYYDVYSMVSSGQPLIEMRLKPTPGRYELRYMTPAGRVLGRQAFTAVQAQYSLAAPQTLKVAQSFQVTYKGPGQPGDYVTLVPEGAPETTYDQYFSAEDMQGTGTLRAPQTPGKYQLRYNSGRAEKTFAVQNVTVEDASYSVSVPAQAGAGTTLTIRWTGADAPGDYLTLVPRDAPEGSYEQYVNTENGNPLQLKLPLVAGEYEIRYQSSGLNNQVMARAPLTITPPQISLTYPAQVMAGSVLRITHRGPDVAGNHLTIVPVDAPDGTYMNYVYTQDSNPVLLPTPAEPGEYEVRYMNEGNGGSVLHRQKVTLTPPRATLQGAATGRAGANLRITWTGPGGPKDRIVVARKGADASDWLSEVTPGQALQIDVLLPSEAGEYEVRYLSQDIRMLATLSVKVQ